MTRLAVLVFFVASRQHIAQRLRLALMEIGSGAVGSEERRRVVLGANFLARIIHASTDIVKVERFFQPAVGVIGTAVAASAADFLAEEYLLAALGLGREFSRRGNV